MSDASDTPTGNAVPQPPISVMPAPPVAADPVQQAIVATYENHDAAEQAVDRLRAAGVPVNKISIIGRDFQVREDVQGYYRPSDAALEGAREGAWFGGLFGMLLGFGFFIVPAFGALFVLGPLAGLIAGAVGGGAIGALASGLVSMGVPEHEALKYQESVRAGQFLLLVHDAAPDEVLQARSALAGTQPILSQEHTTPPPSF